MVSQMYQEGAKKASRPFFSAIKTLFERHQEASKRASRDPQKTVLMVCLNHLDGLHKPSRRFFQTIKTVWNAFQGGSLRVSTIHAKSLLSVVSLNPFFVSCSTE
jgi:hypothetical protein